MVDGVVRASDLAARLGHVRWIGGGSGAGKSTVARRLATEQGAVVYDTDAAMADHVQRCDASDAPLLAAFLAMDMDERWVVRSPEVMVDTFHWFRGEGFDLIVDDLLQLDDQQPVIAEGFRLLPHLVAPLVSRRVDAVWLLPSPEFRHRAFTSRGTLDDIAGRTSEPEQALHNLLRRDELFTDRLRAELRTLDLVAIEVDIDDGETDVVEAVAGCFWPTEQSRPTPDN